MFNAVRNRLALVLWAFEDLVGAIGDRVAGDDGANSHYAARWCEAFFDGWKAADELAALADDAGETS